MARSKKKYKLREPQMAPKDVVEMGERIAKAHHKHLESAKIGWLMLPGIPKNKGKTVLGRAKKIGSAERMFCDVDFIIGLPLDSWGQLTADQKVAVIDHELCHCGIKLDKDMRSKFCILPHDVEDFTAVIERHGVWTADRASFCQAASRAVQLSIDFEQKKTA